MPLDSLNGDFFKNPTWLRRNLENQIILKFLGVIKLLEKGVVWFNKGHFSKFLYKLQKVLNML
jgi:hypothetical protein